MVWRFWNSCGNIEKGKTTKNLTLTSKLMWVRFKEKYKQERKKLKIRRKKLKRRK
jgi:hypothetical protein